MKFTTGLILLIISFTISCDLENRYPEAGEFCTPMQEKPTCIKMDFRNKTLIFNDEKLALKMINRAQYEKVFELNKLSIDLLTEHRIRIQTVNLVDLKLEKEEIFIRIKGPKVSLWKRIKNWREKKD